MKTRILVLGRPVAALVAACAAVIVTVPAAAADIGVSIQIAQPGVYGRVDIGRFPQPVLISTRPVIVTQPVVVQPVQPVAMWVPPGHRKNWRKHCDRYGACGVPVVFVDEGWYQGHVARGPGRWDDDRPGRGNGHGNGKGRGDDR